MTCTCPTCGQDMPPIKGIRLDDDQCIIMKGYALAHLTPMQARLLGPLVRRHPAFVQRYALMEAQYTLEADWPDMKVLEVRVCLLNKRLAPLGLHIRSRESIGYALEVQQS